MKEIKLTLYILLEGKEDNLENSILQTGARVVGGNGGKGASTFARAASPAVE